MLRRTRKMAHDSSTDGQELEEVHQHGIESAEPRGEDAVCAGQAVDDKFQHFEVDHHEAE